MLIFLAAAAAAPFDVDEDRAPLRPGQVLELGRGAEPGTWRLRYRGRVRWAAEPERPVVVKLVAGFGGEPVDSVVLEAQDTFVFSVDLAPGTWSLEAGERPIQGRYWQALGPRLHLEEDGRASCVSNCAGLWRALVLHTTSPAPAEVVAGRPTLTWEAVPGAVRYELTWFEHAAPDDRVVAEEQNIAVQGTSWTFPRELPEGRRISWDVRAVDGEVRLGGFDLARGGSSFLTPGGELPRAASTPASGTGFLGASLTSGESGVSVLGVLAGHAAEAAGLRPGDVIEVLDGQAFRDVGALITEVSDRRPGDVVHLRVRRGEKVLELEVTLGARP